MPNQLTQYSATIDLLIECCRFTPESVKLETLSQQITQWESLIQSASRHGVLPLIHQALKNTASVPEEIKESLKNRYRQISFNNMAMSAELIRIMKLLSEHGIPALAFKGPVLSQMIYGDITQRQYGDLDILIHPNDLYKGVDILEKHGYSSAYPLNERQFKSYCDIAHDYALINKKNGVLVELHWRLLSSEFMANLDTIDFFTDTTTITIQGKKLKTLQLEELIIYLCIHGAKHQWERLEWLVDIAYLIKTQSIDWERLIKLTYQINSEKMVMSAFNLCKNFFKTDFTPEIEDHLQEPAIQKISKNLEIHFIQHFSDSLTTSVKTKTISLIQFQLLDGTKNKLLFLTSLFKPTQLDYLSYHLPNKLTFLYYFIRPLNIIKRWSRKISIKK